MNNENNNDIYQEDNGFNNQGVVDSPDKAEPVEQQTQFPRAGKGGSNFGNIAQGLPGQLKNKENNPGLGLPKNKNNNNNPAKGQQKPENKNKKDGLGDKNKKNDQNKNKGQNNKNNDAKRPLPGAGTNKKDDRRDKKPDQNKNDNNKKSPLGGMNPFTRGRDMLKSRFGMGKNKESGKGVTAPNLNDIAKQSFLKKAWLMAPIQVKIIVITIVPVLLLLALIMAAIFGGTTAATVASMCGATDYDVNGTDATEFLCSMTSPFGENKYTVSGTSGWRLHPTLGTKKFHYGTDVYVNGSDLSIHAVQAGTIKEIGANGSWGNTILIDHGNFTTRYAHLSKFESGLKKGDKVTQGQKIGTEGSTGRSTGNHLHLELRDSEGKYLSANPFFGYSDQGYEDCINDSVSGDLSKCNFKKNKEARYIGEEGFNQICGKTSNYTSSDNSDCCETDNNQGDGNSNNIREFISIFEGSGGYCDSAKTQYKAYQNPGDRVTIGHGVTSDYIPGLKLGQCISVSEVDAAQDRAIESKRNGVIKPKFIGVNLEKHQEDALTSMAFNGCGTYFTGIAKAAQSGDLKAVWNAMKGCTNGRNLGLERRRKAEFALYVTGDYNVAKEYKSKTWTKSQYDDYDSDGVIAKKASGTSSTCTSSGSGSGDVVARANEEYEKWNKSTSTERSELLKNYIEACGNGRTCTAWCAGFVTYILKETGKLDNVKGYSCMANSYRNVKPAEHHRQGSGYTPQPGDVIVYASREHVALVEKVEGKTVHLIGGNQTGKNTPSCYRNAITKKTIAVDSSDIYEYVTIGG